jgi:hypothetical protein
MLKENIAVCEFINAFGKTYHDGVVDDEWWCLILPIEPFK